MDLFTDDIVNTDVFKSVVGVIESIYNKKKKNISYIEFKTNFKKLGNLLMQTYLQQSGLINDKRFQEPQFVVKKMENCIDGIYSKTKIIKFNEKSVKKLYNGDFKRLFSLFHELNHFKVDCDISNNVLDLFLYQVLKEKLLCDMIDKNLDDMFTSYYFVNYKYFSEEVYADVQSIVQIIKLSKLCNININKKQIEFLTNQIKLMMKRWNNHNRNISNFINYDSCFMNLNELFDVAIKHKKEWLKEYPILGVEYYFDREGNIQKRSIDEIIGLEAIVVDSNVKKFIKQLIYNKKSSQKSKKQILRKILK